MKIKIIIVTFILSLGNFTEAQNLVYNGDFESYSTCVNSTGQIAYATGWYASCQSPDYFNSCSNSTGIKVPNTTLGYQLDCCGGDT